MGHNIFQIKTLDKNKCIYLCLYFESFIQQRDGTRKEAVKNNLYFSLATLEYFISIMLTE